MIISCEKCATRFRVEVEKLGATGRMVRCTACRHVWHQLPPGERQRIVVTHSPAKAPPAAGDAPAPTAPPKPRLDPAQAAAQAEAKLADMLRPKPRPDSSRALGEATRAEATRLRANLPALADGGQRRTRLYFGWAALAVSALTFLAVAFLWRETLAARYARAQAFYTLIGLKDGTARLDGREALALLDIRVAERAAERRDGRIVAEIPGEIVNRGTVRLAVPMLQGVLCDAGEEELYAWRFRAPVTALEAGQSASFTTRVDDVPPTTAKLRVLFSSEYARLARQGMACRDRAVAS
ncbi:MAG: zinc-ribbon domain-containing protein [Pseudomonadota bacterium]